VKDRDIMVVMPTGLNTDFADHDQFTDGFRVKDFFFRELMPLVYGWLPASSRREDNYLAGYSMGAAAAWMFGLEHPECFSKVFPLGSPPKDYRFLEPYREWTADEFRKKALASPTSFPAGYGNPKAGIHRKEVNMITKYDTVGAFLDSYEHTCDRYREAVNQGTNLPEIYLLCDTGERSYDKVKAFEQQTKAWENTGLIFEYTEKGFHEYAFCDDVLPRVLELCFV
jgi:putative tributyrin esterase